MKEYQKLVKDILKHGTHKSNRTGVDTISCFSMNYKINLTHGFPLLTTKKMDDYRWNSLIYETLWYLSGQEHIKDLKTKTKIWNNWADEEGRLETAYGRFWRRFPVPEKGLDGEVWVDKSSSYVNIEEDGSKTIDQIKYVIDTLKTDPNSRRLVVEAWHPGNAIVSKLPPCHYTFVFNVQDGKLNLHLTQRSGDVAIGIPFNLAAYSILDIIIAQQTGLKPGIFSHSIVDAHIYCGKGERSLFYKEELKALRNKVTYTRQPEGYLEIKEWIERNSPKKDNDEKDLDHIPGLLKQLSREPKKQPVLLIANKPLEDLVFEDFRLIGYDSHPPIKFGIAV